MSNRTVAWLFVQIPSIVLMWCVSLAIFGSDLKWDKPCWWVTMFIAAFISVLLGSWYTDRLNRKRPEGRAK